jgi:hypothetical protein
MIAGATRRALSAPTAITECPTRVRVRYRREGFIQSPVENRHLHHGPLTTEAVAEVDSNRTEMHVTSETAKPNDVAGTSGGAYEGSQ